ncbi:MAG: hypothetical protein AAF409_05405 [Pseudomonadota bacterium]
MSTLRNSFAAVTLVFAIALAVPGHAVSIFVTQDEYLALEPRQQRDFVAGVYDAHAVLLDAGLIQEGRAHGLISKGVRCSGSMPASEMRDLLNRYIAQRNGRPSDSPASLLFFALAELC